MAQRAPAPDPAPRRPASRAPVRLRFRRRALAALPGETLSQALLRADLVPWTRSLRYHRPRGPFCGLGQCTGCLVNVGGEPNVRACQAIARDGDVVQDQNGWPSSRWDFLELLDLIFPRHLDTLHGFRRPAVFTPLYQRVVRRLAGYGKLPPGAPPPFPRSLQWDAELLVVGGGPAGSAIAEGLAGRFPELSVLLLDRHRRGSLPEATPGNLRRHRGASLIFLPPPEPSGPFRGLVALDSGATAEVTARRVVLATGGYDASLVFADNDRPGICTGDGALAVVPPDSPPPFAHAALVGATPRAAELLRALGPAVEHLVSLEPLDPRARQEWEGLGPRVLDDRLVLGSTGGRRVDGLRLKDRRSGALERIRADAVILAVRRLPNVPLFSQVGAALEWRAGVGAYFPVLWPSGETSVLGLYAAGEAAGFSGMEAALSSSERVVSALTAELRGERPSLPPAPPGERNGPEQVPFLLSYYHEWLRSEPRGKAFLCPCEDVVVEELDEAVHEGFQGAEEIKRVTGTGTGLCQGRYCLPEALLLLSVLEGRSPQELGYITQRPPVWPVYLGGLAAPPLPDPASEVPASETAEEEP